MTPDHIEVVREAISKAWYGEELGRSNRNAARAALDSLEAELAEAREKGRAEAELHVAAVAKLREGDYP
jgi:hypothetical protein